MDWKRLFNEMSTAPSMNTLVEQPQISPGARPAGIVLRFPI